jgi:hypothetical protein
MEMQSEDTMDKLFNVNAPKYEVSGVARIIDKDGNVKSEMKIVSLEINEELTNAIKHDT